MDSPQGQNNHMEKFIIGNIFQICIAKIIYEQGQICYTIQKPRLSGRIINNSYDSLMKL